MTDDQQGARVARYAKAIQACYDLDTEVSVQEWDGRVANAVMAVADQETVELRAERDSIFGKVIEFKRKYIETKARAEAAEAESAHLASEQRELAAQVAALRSLVAKVPDVCPLSKRADGKHSFRFDGDDPYIVCHFCDEMRDSLTGRVIRPAASSADKAGE